MITYFPFLILQDVDHCEPNSKSKQTGFRINGNGLRPLIFCFISTQMFFVIGTFVNLQLSYALSLIRKQLRRVYMWCPPFHWIRSNTNESDIWNKLYWLHEEWTENVKGKRDREHPHKQGWGKLYRLSFLFLNAPI